MPATLLLTTTGEPYQPVRLKWSVPGKPFCISRLEALECVGVDAETKALTVWLTGEAAALKFWERAAPMAPTDGRLVILGTFKFPNTGTMVLEVRSITRAIELARLVRRVLGEKAKLTRVRVINRWFDAAEGADDLRKLDKGLDQNVTVIRWEDTADAFDAFVEQGKTVEERRALHAEWDARRRHLDVPPVEDFPCHPEEESEDMRDLQTTLNFRLMRAARQWGGERVTLRQVIEEAVAKMPPVAEPG